MGNSFFNEYPYTDFHELNLSWVIKELRTFATTLEQFVSINALKYADPIQWNITSQYEKNTIVIDPVTGVAYISVAPVPAGVIITNTDYWTPVFDLGALTEKAGRNIANKYEENTTLTATFPSNVNDWLIWGDVLYRVISPIIAGDQYVVGSNLERFTLENIIGHLQDLTTTDKSNLVSAINEVLTTLTNTTGDLADLTTTDKSNLVSAINEVLTTLTNTTGDLADLTTTDKSNLVSAINEIVDNIGDLSTLTTTDKSSIVNSIIEVVNTVSANKMLSPYVNVKDYGAKGDYNTDDTQAFKDAIADAVATKKNTVYVPHGYYLITDSLELNYCSILGDQNSMLVCDADGLEYLIKLGHEANIDHIRFVHDRGHFPDYDIYVEGNKTIINNCLFQNYKTAVKIGNFVNGTRTTPVFPIIMNTSFGSNRTDGYAILDRCHAFMIISNCQMLGPTSGTQPLGAIYIRHGDTCVLNNINISNHGQALRIEPPINDSVYSFYASNCLFDNAKTTTAGSNIPCCELIRSSGASAMIDFKFVNCWFGFSSGSDGCRALGSSGNIIDALEFINCDFTGNHNNGLTMNYVENCKVIGCNISNNTYCGIQMGVGTNNGVIANNRIGLTARGTNGNGIKIDTALIANIIVNNNMYGNNYDALQGNGSGNMIKHNYPDSVNIIDIGTMKTVSNIPNYWDGSAWTIPTGNVRYSSGNLEYWDASAWTIPTGSVRYNASQLQYWDGSAWTNIS